MIYGTEREENEPKIALCAENAACGAKNKALDDRIPGRNAQQKIEHSAWNRVEGFAERVQEPEGSAKRAAEQDGFR